METKTKKNFKNNLFTFKPRIKTPLMYNKKITKIIEALPNNKTKILDESAPQK
jgi:hypothetical protein